MMFKEQMHMTFDNISPSDQLLDKVSQMMREEAGKLGKKPPLRFTAMKYAGIAAAVAVTAGVVVLANNLSGSGTPNVAVTQAAQTADIRGSEEDSDPTANGVYAAGAAEAQDGRTAAQTDEADVQAEEDAAGNYDAMDYESAVTTTRAASEVPAAAEPAAEPVTEPAAEPAAEPAVSSAAEIVTEPMSEPVTSSAPEPVYGTAAADAVQPPAAAEAAPEETAAAEAAPEEAAAAEAAPVDEPAAPMQIMAVPDCEEAQNDIQQECDDDPLECEMIAEESTNADGDSYKMIAGFDPMTGGAASYDEYMNSQYELFREKCPMNLVRFTVTRKNDGSAAIHIDRDMLSGEDLDIDTVIVTHDELFTSVKQGRTYMAYIPYILFDDPWIASEALAYELYDGYAWHGTERYYELPGYEGDFSAEREEQSSNDLFERLNQYNAGELADYFRKDWTARGFEIKPFSELCAQKKSEHEAYLRRFEQYGNAYCTYSLPKSGNTDWQTLGDAQLPSLAELVKKISKTTEPFPEDDAYPLPADGYDVCMYLYYDSALSPDISLAEINYCAGQGCVVLCRTDGTQTVYPFFAETAKSFDAVIGR